MPQPQDSVTPPRRFVVQHHRLGGDEHWDLMLEAGEVLWTWRLAAPPTTARDRSVAATRIGDHRRLYLTYEGPLSGDRGTVRIVDRGTYELLQYSSESLRLEVQGNVLAGRYRLDLRGPAPDAWVLFREAPGA